MQSLQSRLGFPRKLVFFDDVFFVGDELIVTKYICIYNLRVVFAYFRLNRGPIGDLIVVVFAYFRLYHSPFCDLILVI